MTHPDKAASFAAIGTAVDLFELDELKRRLRSPAETDDGDGGEAFVLHGRVRRHDTQAYMERSGATVEDFAQVAVKNHHHGARNPKAQYRDEVTRRGGARQPGDLRGR